MRKIVSYETNWFKEEQEDLCGACAYCGSVETLAQWVMTESAVMPSTCAVSRLAPVSWRTTLHNALGRVLLLTLFTKVSFILSRDRN